MGKITNLFKKIKYIMGIFHAKMGTIKEWYGVQETDEIKKRWQEYIEEL